MAIKRNGKNLKHRFYGGHEIKYVYRGTKLIWRPDYLEVDKNILVFPATPQGPETIKISSNIEWEIKIT